MIKLVIVCALMITRAHAHHIIIAVIRHPYKVIKPSINGIDTPV